MGQSAIGRRGGRSSSSGSGDGGSSSNNSGGSDVHWNQNVNMINWWLNFCWKFYSPHEGPLL